MHGELADLRVGFLLDHWRPSRGGAEAALADLAGHLAGRGARVVVIAAGAEPSSLPANGRYLRVRARGLTRARRERELARALVAAARAACDVTIGVRHLPEVDLYWPHGGSYRASLAARRAARGRTLETEPRGRHRVFLELERELFEGGAAFGGAERRVASAQVAAAAGGRGGDAPCGLRARAPRAQRIVCVSELVRAELAAAYPNAAERLVVVENGVDLERFHPRERATRGALLRRSLGVPAGMPLVAFSAREPRLKGLPELLAALADLRGRGWFLLAAGMKDASAWRRAAAALGIERARCAFLPEVDAVALAAGADLVVLPTWRDTSSFVVLESLACGTPVVTTTRAGASTAVGPQAGSVIEAGDHAALCAELDGWLARAAGVEREAVRACVLERDRGRWLTRLAELVLQVARG